MRARQMHLMAYLKTGPTATHPGGWRHPATDLDTWSFERYEHIARVLEAACFDGCFYADTLGIPDIYQDSFRAYVENGGQLSYLDPMMVLPIMARVTKHLGLGATLSTTFHHPYHLARMLASIDLLSKGRACWNIVTSTTNFEARNFGLEQIPAKADRYDRGDEVVEAACALWNCWGPDALVMDKASGLFAHPEQVTYADYVGEHVSTRGPMTMPRSPQGRPVLMQAGSSPRGREFAARWAEAIFCNVSGTAQAVELYADIKGRMGAYGREPWQCVVLPAISVVVGETESIAREKEAYMNALIPGELAMATQSAMLGADLGRAKTDAEFVAARGEQGHGGIEERYRHAAKTEGISFVDAVKKPRKMVVGTPEMVADHMQAMFDAEGCDGFVLTGNVTPGCFEDFGRMVVPELQRRGLFRREYVGGTMRENLLT